MPPKGRKGTSAVMKDDKIEKVDSDGDNEKEVETKQSSITKALNKDDDASDENAGMSPEEDTRERKRETKRKSYKEESDEEEAAPKKRASRAVKPKAKLVDASEEEEEDEEDESGDEYVPPSASPRGKGRTPQRKRKGDDSDDSGSYGKKSKRSSKKPKRKPKRKNDSDFSEEDDSDEDWGSAKKSAGRSKGTPRGRKAQAETPTRRGERATRVRQKVASYAEEDDDESDGPSVKSKPKERKSVEKVEKKSKMEEDEEIPEEEDEFVEEESKDSKQANGRKGTDKAKSADSENGVKEELDEVEDEENDMEESKPAAKRKGEKPPPPSKKPAETQDFSTMDFSCDKKTPDGKPWNLKISSWNVAGLRAVIKKNGLEYLTSEKPDILCLQETKCPEKKLPAEAKVEGYHAFWDAGDRDGHGGIGMYSKEKPLEVKHGIGNPEFDTEGRVFTAEYEKFYLVNVYVPNSGRGLVNLPKRMKWDTEFREYLKKLDEKKPVILTGDLNVAHQPIDLANPKTNTKNAGFTQEERDGFTKLLDEGFVDSFRHLYPDKTGAYTFWTNMKNSRERNVGWRLDYFVLSKRLLTNICENTIRSQVYGSDHCPITLFMNV